MTLALVNVISYSERNVAYNKTVAFTHLTTTIHSKLKLSLRGNQHKTKSTTSTLQSQSNMLELR